MAEIEAPQLKMQLVRDGDNILIDFEPPLSEEQKGQITANPEFIDIPEELFGFRDREPAVGNPFTELNCAAIRAGLKEKRLILSERNLARQIADVLTRQGTIVEFDDFIKPIEQSGYMFRGLTSVRPE